MGSDKLIEFLEDYHIPYKTSGENVKTGWIELCCPFCGDSAFHLGISPSLGYNCWVCGEKGSFYNLISALLPTIDKRAVYSLYFKGLKQIEAPRKQNELAFAWPQYLDNVLPENAKQYLFGERRYDPDWVTQKYQLKWGNRLSNYAYRIIIPVIIDRVTVGFVARAIGDIHPKYKNSVNFNRASAVYNLDNVRKNIVVVEGIFDAWRIGDGAVATLGIEWTVAQAKLILDKKPGKIFVMYDGEGKAWEHADALAWMLSGFVDTEVVYLEEGIDPDTMPEEQVNEVQRWL